MVLLSVQSPTKRDGLLSTYHVQVTVAYNFLYFSKQPIKIKIVNPI